MKMETIDERIQKALSSEDRALLQELDSGATLYGDIAATFRGRMRWMNVMGWVAGVAMLGFAIYCGWHFFTEIDLRTMQLWGAGTVVSAIALGLFKLWFFMEIQRTAILREIKRVELQIANLTDAVRGRDA
jgi:hypothetical protein